MKRVFIVTEGQTEQEFVNTVLSPYLRDFGIYSVTPVLIRTSKSGRGGFVNCQHLANTIKGLLSGKSTEIIVTSFVDFFRMPNNMPSYTECVAKVSKCDQIECLETAMYELINDSRFLPYIQLHEFEALLFSNNNGFEYLFDKKLAVQTSQIVMNYDNPEDINSTPEGAPSKRILAIKNNYDKVTEGNLIALEVGINTMLERCPRFKNWIDKIIDRCKIQ
ncbi:MAG: DUF4276 family protein [Phocaeicola sp.]